MLFSASKGPMIAGDKKALPMHEFRSKDSVDAVPVINMSAKRNKLPPKSEEIQANGLFEHINQKQRESMSETEDSFSALVSGIDICYLLPLYNAACGIVLMSYVFFKIWLVEDDLVIGLFCFIANFLEDILHYWHVQYSRTLL